MRSSLRAWGLAMAALVAAVLLRWALDPLMGDTLPLVTLFGAVAAAVWVGGLRAAIVVALLGYLACDYLFLQPRGRLGLDDAGKLVGVAAYLFTSGLIIAFGEATRIAHARSNERRELLQVTLRSIGDAVITTDNWGRITYLNAVAEALTGWTHEDALGKPLDKIFRIVSEETRQPVQNPAAVALRKGHVVGLASPTLLIRKDGVEYAIDDSAAPIRDQRGQVSGCVLIFRDVTAQRDLERDKRNQLLTARLLSSIVETSDDAIISKTLDGVIQTWNAGAERIFGYSAEEAIGRHISLIIPAERMSEEDHIVSNLKAGQRIEHFETERLKSDGSRLWVSLTISPIKDGAGNVVGASKIVRDVTRQREADSRERQLLAEAAGANAKFRAFFEQGQLFAGILDLDGTLIETNRMSWEGCGYTKEQVVGKKFWEGPWWAPSPALVEQIKEGSALAAAGETFRAELKYYVSDGSERMTDVTIQPIRDVAGQIRFLAMTGTDITERKRAEADREKFVAVIESSRDFIGMCDMKGIPFFVNRAGLAMVGLDTLEQARQTPIREFFFPEDQLMILESFFPSVLEKGHGEIEVRFRHFKTGEGRWMVYKVLTLLDEAGQPVGLATVSQDVTERRRLEDDLRNLAADLSEADRRKDEFLAMLAHELRNPLAPISNAVQALRLRGNGAEALHSASELLERQVRQMARLVDDLLDVSRITRGKIELRRERIELAPLIHQAVEAVRVPYKSMNHELTVELPEQPIYLNADAARLTQVIGNLLNNACKFTDKGGHISLNVSRNGEEAVIQVRDDGIGISPENLPRLFDMFTQVDTSLERSRDGLGIGLTLVKSLVEMHGGMVEAHSDGLGRGSRFVVRLPVLDEARQPVPESPAGGEATVGRRILIVDDNEDGADSLAMLLELGGHQVHVARDGLEALEAAERLRPEVMLLDIGLPKLNGYEVCKRIREKAWGKDLLLVAVTGWGQEEDRHRSKAAGFNAHIVKPVDTAALGKLLASLSAHEAP